MMDVKREYSSLTSTLKAGRQWAGAKEGDEYDEEQCSSDRDGGGHSLDAQTLAGEARLPCGGSRRR